MKKTLQNTLFLLILPMFSIGQALRIPQNVNFPSMAGRKVSSTEILIHWNAPRVNGREGKIWGTDVAYFGTQVLGYGSNVASPWRAGADECTTISFSTDVKINGKALAAGTYALFMELQRDSTILIFNKNKDAWGSYFYDKSLDVLRVVTYQKKQQPFKERLEYNFTNQSVNSIDISLDWENWSIPFNVQIDAQKTILEDIKKQMSGELGFDPPSLIAAANWCVRNNINLEEALNWINSASSPTLGGIRNFRTLSTQAKILEKLGRENEMKSLMEEAIQNATVLELHQYGRELLGQNKVEEAIQQFELNYKKHNGAWPTNTGLMRGYSAKGDYKKALEFAKKALEQEQDDTNKSFIIESIKKLEQGKAI